MSELGLALNLSLVAWQFRKRELIRALRDDSIRFNAVEQLLAGAHDGILEEIRDDAF